AVGGGENAPPRRGRATGGAGRGAPRLGRAATPPRVRGKFPATTEGLPVIEECIAAGMNVNVTLIFSLHRYREGMDAYVRGLTRPPQAGMRGHPIASRARFFLNPVDTQVGPPLPEPPATPGAP